MENNKNNILGCFVSNTMDAEWSILEQNQKLELGKVFRSYVYGEKGIDNILKTLNNEDYGNDLKLALFQFYIKPIPYLLQHLKEIESYRKKEKAIGIPIIVTDENFFSKSEEERYGFLKKSILQKMDLLSEVVKKKKLDTNMVQLKNDLKEILMLFG